ncbi:MAG: exosortase/archaeosortase family protein [Verrucomicrobiae bacterium]|nr:exosortase/archaeosortase family protein [Verrucomicrobiae bacterium]MCP5541778.1 exosortase/archaeosortase family protein [Akkermansiaceae bacterium]
MTESSLPKPGAVSVCVPVGIVAAVFAILFAVCPYATGYGADRHSIAYWLWYFWRFPDWQHGALVPPLALWLVWRRRENWRGLPAEGSNWALPVVLTGFFLFFAGVRANLYYLGYASAHLLLLGTILWLGGRAWLRELAFPLCFLAFMWPLYFLESRVGFPLRLLMTHLCSGLLDLGGVEHLQLGTAIVSPADAAAGLARGDRFALEVANPCSGIRSLFALMMLGALYGGLAFGNRPFFWAAMWIAAVPLAIAGNVVRILLLMLGSRLFGSAFAIGSDGGTSAFHFFAGIMVFLVAAGGMVLLAKLLRRLDRGSGAGPSPWPRPVAA